MSGSLGAFAEAPAPPPVVVPVAVIPVGATPSQIGNITNANLAANLAGNQASLAAEQAQSTAAQNASNAAAAATLAAQQAAAAKAAVIPLTGQTNSFAPGTAPGTTGSLTQAAAGTGLLSPAGEANLAAANPQPGNSTPNAQPITPVASPPPPTETTLPDVIDLTPAAPAVTPTPDIPVAQAPIAAEPAAPTTVIATNDAGPTVTIPPDATPPIVPTTATPLSSAVETPVAAIVAPQEQPPAPSGNSPAPPQPAATPDIPTATAPDSTKTATTNAADSNNSGVGLDANGNVTQNGVPVAGGGGTSAVKDVGGQTWAQDAQSGQWFTLNNTGQFVAQTSTPPGSSTDTANDFGSGPVTPPTDPTVTSPGVQQIIDSKTSLTPTAGNPDPLNGLTPATSALPVVSQPTTGDTNPDEQNPLAKSGPADQTDITQFGLGPVNDNSNNDNGTATNLPATTTQTADNNAAGSATNLSNDNSGDTISAAQGNNAGNQPLAFINSDSNTISTFDPNTGLTSVDPTGTTNPPLVSSAFDVAKTAATAATMIASEGRARAGIISDEANLRNQSNAIRATGSSEQNVLTDVTNQMGIGPAQGPGNQIAAMIQGSMVQAEGQPLPAGSQVNDVGDTATTNGSLGQFDTTSGFSNNLFPNNQL